MATLAEAAQITMPAGASPDGASELAAFTPSPKQREMMLFYPAEALRFDDADVGTT